MSDEKAIYWLTQVSGWFGYILLILFQNLLVGNVDLGIVKVLFVNFALGIVISHGMRWVIIRSGMLSMRILTVIPRIMGLTIAAGILSSLVYALISDFLFTGVAAILKPPFGLYVELLFPFTTIYLFWNILYFAAIYLKNYEREEVKNLRLTASMNEIELGNLRAQLNPHFMFNALNSIRALIDEHPEQAKISLTRMSRILRSSLLAGKRKLVPLSDEVSLVMDYLALEKMRYEERLEYVIDVPDALQSILVPPILIQTLTENAIKHGISHLPKGGTIRLTARSLPNDMASITVTNSGRLRAEAARSESQTAVGLNNSRRRLKLLYGDFASLSIAEKDEEVNCEVCIPTKLKFPIDHENTDN